MSGTKKEKLESILKSLKKVGGIESSLIASRDGLVIASDLPKGVYEDSFAAMSAAMQGAAETAVSEMKKGELNEIIVDSAHGKIITISAGKPAILVIMTKPKINLGLILMEIRKARSKILSIFGEDS